MREGDVLSLCVLGDMYSYAIGRIETGAQSAIMSQLPRESGTDHVVILLDKDTAGTVTAIMAERVPYPGTQEHIMSPVVDAARNQMVAGIVGGGIATIAFVVAWAMEGRHRKDEEAQDKDEEIQEGTPMRGIVPLPERDVAPSDDSGDSGIPIEETASDVTQESNVGDVDTPEEDAGDADTLEEDTGDVDMPEEDTEDVDMPEENAEDTDMPEDDTGMPSETCPDEPLPEPSSPEDDAEEVHEFEPTCEAVPESDASHQGQVASDGDTVPESSQAGENQEEDEAHDPEDAEHESPAEDEPEDGEAGHAQTEGEDDANENGDGSADGA